jgi:hypothetical protein
VIQTKVAISSLPADKMQDLAAAFEGIAKNPQWKNTVKILLGRSQNVQSEFELITRKSYN